MLRELSVRNFVLIDDLNLSFAPGFNVLTGETGAGKSILIGALSLLLGGRATPELIRTGSEEAQIEGLFDRPPTSPSAPDSDPHADPWDAEEILLRRVLQRSGKGRASVNGSLATLSNLERVSGRLFEIHGQHAHHGLTDPAVQLALLDTFSGATDMAREFLERFQRLILLQKEKENLEENKSNLLKENDFIKFQLHEIDEARVQPGEEAALLQEEKLLQNSEEIARLAHASWEALSGEGGVLETLGRLSSHLQSLERLGAGEQGEARMLEEARLNLKELSHGLGRRAQGQEFDPARLEAISERLQKIGKLKKKYGGSAEALAAYREDLAGRLSQIQGGEERLAQLDDLIRDQEKLCSQLSHKLGRLRRDGAKRLEDQMEKELGALQMGKTRFQVAVESVPPYRGGTERAEFMIALPGEPPRPVGKVASGGELSRIMMAVKATLSAGDPTPTLIFDEIDAGIGGAVAEKVGRRLRQLARAHQVLSVTHLPQIASFAERHFSVRKRQVQGRMRTEVTLLEGEERVEEIARMLGGQKITPTTRQHAQEMLSWAVKSRP